MSVVHPSPRMSTPHGESTLWNTPRRGGDRGSVSEKEKRSIEPRHSTQPKLTPHQTASIPQRIPNKNTNQKIWCVTCNENTTQLFFLSLLVISLRVRRKHKKGDRCRVTIPLPPPYQKPLVFSFGRAHPFVLPNPFAHHLSFYLPEPPFIIPLVASLATSARWNTFFSTHAQCADDSRDGT